MASEYRHEWKYEINNFDKMMLQNRLGTVMKRDKNSVDGIYQIRSLYFDTMSNKALWEKLDGVNEREKFRLRYYNGNTDFIRLEKKSKKNGLSKKESVLITKEEVQKILDGKFDWILSEDRPLLRELYVKMKNEGLRPRAIVDYSRIAFVYKAGNVRVTLDYDIRTGMNSVDFLNPNSLTVPVPRNPIILEVKWDEFLPDCIKMAVALDNRGVGAFSKYAACRSYT